MLSLFVEFFVEYPVMGTMTECSGYPECQGVKTYWRYVVNFQDFLCSGGRGARSGSGDSRVGTRCQVGQDKSLTIMLILYMGILAKTNNLSILISYLSLDILQLEYSNI